MGGGGGLYTWTDCKVFLGWWIGWGVCPRCLCLSAHSERKLHYERSALSTPIIASYCCSTEKVIEKKGKRTIPSWKYHPIAYEQNTAHLKVSFLHAVTLPPRNRRTRVAARSAVDYCQLLWQQYGYIIIASSCGNNMVTLLLPVSLTKKYGCIIIATSCGNNMLALLLPVPATEKMVAFLLPVLVAIIWLHRGC